MEGQTKKSAINCWLVHSVFVDCSLVLFFFLIVVAVWNISFLRIYFVCERCWRYIVKFQTVIFQESQLLFLIISRKPLIFYFLTSALLFITCHNFHLLCFICYFCTYLFWNFWRKSDSVQNIIIMKTSAFASWSSLNHTFLIDNNTCVPDLHNNLLIAGFFFLPLSFISHLVFLIYLKNFSIVFSVEQNFPPFQRVIDFFYPFFHLAIYFVRIAMWSPMVTAIKFSCQKTSCILQKSTLDLVYLFMYGRQKSGLSDLHHVQPRADDSGIGHQPRQRRHCTFFVSHNSSKMSHVHSEKNLDLNDSNPSHNSHISSITFPYLCDQNIIA